MTALALLTRIALAGLLTLGALTCTLVFAAARSDFAFRGCGEISRVEWEARANCHDAWFAQVFMAVLGGFCVLCMVLILRRGRAVGDAEGVTQMIGGRHG